MEKRELLLQNEAVSRYANGEDIYIAKIIDQNPTLSIDELRVKYQTLPSSEKQVSIYFLHSQI